MLDQKLKGSEAREGLDSDVAQARQLGTDPRNQTEMMELLLHGTVPAVQGKAGSDSSRQPRRKGQHRLLPECCQYFSLLVSLPPYCYPLLICFHP